MSGNPGVVITFGTFDMLHVGHVNIIARSRAEGSRLVVGVSSDALNAAKGNTSTYAEADRMRIVAALKGVDDVFLEESLEMKPEYCRRYNASTLCMGDDWAGKFDDMPCRVVYFPRTPGISTTAAKIKVRGKGR